MSSTNVRVKASSPHSESREPKPFTMSGANGMHDSGRQSGNAVMNAEPVKSVESVEPAKPARAAESAKPAEPAKRAESAPDGDQAKYVKSASSATGDAAKSGPSAFGDIAKKAQPYLDKHGHELMYGAIGIVAAILILTIGFWPVFLLAVFAAIGIAIGKFRDSGGSMQTAAKSLVGNLHR